MKSPIILQGQPFDWEAAGKAMLNAVDETGQVNWTAALLADPGVMRCPDCDLWLWREGDEVECPDCHVVFDVATREIKRNENHES